MSIVSAYLTELRTIRNLGAGVAETTYYGPLSTLFNAVGKSLKPKVLCLLHLQNTGAGIPDAGFFSANQIQRTTGTAVPGQPPSRGVLEAKPFNVNINTLASSQQVLTYLKHYNQVLITNLREFQLLVLENGVPRKVEEYKLAVSTEALFVPATLQQHETLFPEFLERVLRRQSVITDPGDLAWFLASYAREGRARVETHGLTSFDTIKSALEQSLGLTFEGEKGLHFFRSTLVQTLFYGIFSAWVIWCRTDGFSQSARFDWRTSASYLNVPVLRKLFNEVADPGPLNAIQLTEMLSLAGDTLARVDRSAFFSRFSEADAVQYFYEPFLEAFDPELRKDLGVWYTPREIVRYMVERIDHLLRTELGQVDGLASPDVCVLDPCCGTGAYLTEVLDRIHRTLKLNAGDDDAYVASDLRTAALTRIFGFEILPAPFVIAHLQLAAQLQQLGAPLTGVQRAGVYLTNSLTGWVPEQEPKKSIFPDLQKEKEDAEAVKRRANILVILGNPPYNGYSGISRMQEERDLFPHALAILHTPAYRMENAGALLGDWPRVPLPSTNELLAQSAILGRKLLSLLDPETAVKLPVDHNFFAALKRPKDAEDKPDLYYISGGWGSRGQGNTVMPGRGKFETRPWTAQEIAKLHSIAAQHSIPSETIMLLLGESCVDARLNDVVFWSAIPVNVWDYTLGGYQVLKKWLSYREGALLGRPLRIDEVRYFAEVVRRITSILLLGPALNSSYASLLPEATPLL